MFVTTVMPNFMTVPDAALTVVVAVVPPALPLLEPIRSGIGAPIAQLFWYCREMHASANVASAVA